jgi:hypothetical protein
MPVSLSRNLPTNQTGGLAATKQKSETTDSASQLQQFAKRKNVGAAVSLTASRYIIFQRACSWCQR